MSNETFNAILDMMIKDFENITERDKEDIDRHDKEGAREMKFFCAGHKACAKTAMIIIDIYKNNREFYEYFINM